MYKEQHFSGTRAFVEVDCYSNKHSGGLGLVFQAFIHGFANPEIVEEARRAALKHEAECGGRVLVTFYDDEDVVPENKYNAPLKAGTRVEDEFNPLGYTHAKKPVDKEFEYGWTANDQQELAKIRQFLREEMKKNERKGQANSQRRSKKVRRQR